MSRLRRLLAHAAALGVAVLAAGCYAPLPGPPACDASRSCAPGNTCSLGRCRDAASLPASTLATRVRLRPTGWRIRGEPAWVDGTTGAADELVVDSRHGDTRLVLEFGRLPFARPSTVGSRKDAPRPHRSDLVTGIPQGEGMAGRAIERALMVFEARRSGDGAFGVLDVEVTPESASRERDDSSAEGPRESRTSLPMRLGAFVVSPGEPLVLDVTELVRSWEREHRTAASLEVGALPRAGVRACYALARADSGSPRLEVYLAPTEAERAAARAGAAAPSGSHAPEDEAEPREEEVE